MKRVSRAYGVLSDPDRRLRYDAELARNGAPATPVTRPRKSLSARAFITMGWLICAFSGAIGIGWYMSQQTGVRLHVPITEVKAAPAQPQTAQDQDSVSSELTVAKAERDRALERVTLQEKQIEWLTGTLLETPPASRTGSARFNGIWVLAEPNITTVNSALAPLAADLIVSEVRGALQGRYRARYPTVGRPEALTVRFYLEGRCPSEDVANVTWTGDAGAKGDAQLRLASDHTIEMVWSATDVGSQSTPSSGNVTLARKR
jgi:hypothetical protein